MSVSDHPQGNLSPGVGGAGMSTNAETMREFYAVPFIEPEGGTTWAVREFVYGPDSYLRQIVSWHKTREEAQAEVDRLRAVRG